MNYILLFIIIIIISGCATVPNSLKDTNIKGKVNDDYFPSITPPAGVDYNPFHTPIGRIYADKLKQDESLSGAALIENGVDAFFVRAAFARKATKTIELQTYIYNNDIASRILLQELLEAANRGVKVKILVDDNGMDSDDSDIMLLDAHENIEVKVFNTFKYRSSLARYPQFLFDFNRLNSRMHNKLFIVDGAVVIIGGRNIAKNYFEGDPDTNFSDTDVVFLGNIAMDAHKSFYAYWNYHLSIPASFFPSKAGKSDVIELRSHFETIADENKEKSDAYQTIMKNILKMFRRKEFDFSWGKGRVVYDLPEKVDKSQSEKLKYISPIVAELTDIWTNTKKNIYVSAAYFIPGGGGEMLIKSAQTGVDISIVTNSLSSTDSTAVYAGWERYRKKLIENGINIYEFMNNGKKVKGHKTSSFASLHSKSIVFDDKISWIGSFNLDSRSALFNTEIVAIFESPEFASRLTKLIKEDINSSWKLEIRDGDTVWIDNSKLKPEKEKIQTTDPDTTFFKRLKSTFLKIIPESLL